MFPLATFPDDAQTKLKPEESDGIIRASSPSQRVHPEVAEDLPDVTTSQQRPSPPHSHSPASDRECTIRPVATLIDRWHGPTVLSNPRFVRSFKRRIRTRERRGCRYKTLCSTAELRPPERRQHLEMTDGMADDGWEDDGTFVVGRVKDVPLLEEHDESDTCELTSPGSDSVFLPHQNHSPILSPRKQEHWTDFLGKWRNPPLLSPDSPDQESCYDLSENYQELKERNTGLSFLSRLGKSVSPKKKHFRSPSKSPSSETGWESVSDASPTNGSEATPTSPRSGLSASHGNSVRLTKIPVRTTYVASLNKEPQSPEQVRSSMKGVTAGAYAAKEVQTGRSGIAASPRLPPPSPSRKYGLAPHTVLHARENGQGFRHNHLKDSVTGVQPSDRPGVTERHNESLHHNRVTASCPHLSREMATSPRELRNVEEGEFLERLSPKRVPQSAPCILGPCQTLLSDSASSVGATSPETSHSGRTDDASPRKNKFFPGFVFLADGTVKKSEIERGTSRERGKKEKSGTSEWKVAEAIATLSQGRLKRAGALRKKEDLHHLIADADSPHMQLGTAGKLLDTHEAADAFSVTGETFHAGHTAKNTTGYKTNNLQDRDEVKSFPEMCRDEAASFEMAPRQLSERYVKNRAKRIMERSISVPFWTKFQSQDPTFPMNQGVTEGRVGALQAPDNKDNSAEVKSQSSESKIEHVARAGPGREQRRASHKRARSQDATRSFSAETLSLAANKSSSHENINKRDNSEFSGLAMDLLTADGEWMNVASHGSLELPVPQRHTSCIDVVLAGQNEQEPSGFSRVLWDSKLRSVSAACLTKKGTGGKVLQGTKWFDKEETTQTDQVEGAGSPKAYQHVFTSPYEMLTQPRERPYLQRLMGVFTMLGAVSLTHHIIKHDRPSLGVCRGEEGAGRVA